MNANKKNMPTDWIAPDDAPELTDDFLHKQMNISEQN